MDGGGIMKAKMFVGAGGREVNEWLKLKGQSENDIVIKFITQSSGPDLICIIIWYEEIKKPKPTPIPFSPHSIG